MVAAEMAQTLPEGKLLVHELEPRYRDFVIAYMIYPNAAKAAREAGYDTKKDNNAGWRLRNNKQIKAAIRELMEHDESGPDKLDVGWLREQLRGNMQLALEQGDTRATNKALELIGKTIGAFIDRHEVDVQQSYAELVSQATSDNDVGMTPITVESVQAKLPPTAKRTVVDPDTCKVCGRACATDGHCSKCVALDLSADYPAAPECGVVATPDDPFAFEAEDFPVPAGK